MAERVVVTQCLYSFIFYTINGQSPIHSIKVIVMSILNNKHKKKITIYTYNKHHLNQNNKFL